MNRKKLQEFVKEIVDQVPELKQTLEAHREAYDEVIPYVVMDEFSNYVIEDLRNHRESELFRKFVTAIENRISGDNDVAAMIRTSLCETVDSHWADKVIHNRIMENLPASVKKWLIAP
jgi:hypothetical protein